MLVMLFLMSVFLILFNCSHRSCFSGAREKGEAETYVVSGGGSDNGSNGCDLGESLHLERFGFSKKAGLTGIN